MSTATSILSPNAREGTTQSDPRWVAVYTVARHEKVVAQQLQERRIETFLPLYRSLHRWKDRKKEIELALFPSYVFVRIEASKKLPVLQVPGVVSIVTFNGELAALPEQEIDALRRGLQNQLCAEPCPYLKVGKRVRVVRGPMAGAEGILSRKKDTYRFVISVDVLMRSVAVEVDASDLELVHSPRSLGRGAHLRAGIA
ncbi:MAG TPA: UpxY family transcription antiterminator [Terriglobales bacterium]|nr:UpxY family transcription antiterminator [Terriglobales bacterium]